jgi:ABC-type multidrug transport system fused ATPase/permease subunit
VYTYIQAGFLGRVFDSVENLDYPGLMSACTIFGLSFFCLFIYNGTVWMIYAPFVVRMEKRIRIKLFDKIISFDYGRVESKDSGEWSVRLNRDVETPFSQPLHFPHAACSAVSICVSSLLMWRVSPVSLGLVLLFVVPHIAFGNFYIARAMERLNRKSLELTGENAAELESFILCAGASAVYGAKDYLTERFEESSRRLFEANMEIRKKNAVNAALTPVFGLCGYLVLCIFSVKPIADGAMTFGGLTSVFQYRGGVLAGSMLFINSFISIKASMAGIKRLNETFYE